MADSIQVACSKCGTVNRVPGQRIADRPNCGKCKSPLSVDHPATLDDRSRSKERTRAPALVVHARFLAYQYLKASGEARIYDHTTVEVYGCAEIDVQNAWSLTLSSVFSWQTFNLRIGFGHGNYNIRVVNFVIPARIPYSSGLAGHFFRLILPTCSLSTHYGYW